MVGQGRDFAAGAAEEVVGVQSQNVLSGPGEQGGCHGVVFAIMEAFCVVALDTSARSAWVITRST